MFCRNWSQTKISTLCQISPIVLIKFINTLLLVLFLCSAKQQPQSFKANQLKYSRVKTAYTNKWQELQDLLKGKQLDPNSFSLYIRIFKQEKRLEAWGRNKNEKNYKLIKSYPICASSGGPGPKRQQGDGQVPEGFYDVTAFQPNSSYHLALKVGYPNKSDKLKSRARDLGGDIMIHGNCVTIGCVPIQDGPIEELYVLAVEAKNHETSIRVDIFPFSFDVNNKEQFSLISNPDAAELWDKLKQAQNYFDQNKVLPLVNIDGKGNYIVNTKG